MKAYNTFDDFMAINIQYSSELPLFCLDNSLMSLRGRDRAFSAAMRYSTLYTDTYPQPNPDTSVDRVQPQISQMKNNLKGAAKSHGSAQNNISNRHADYLASSYSHDEKAIRAELKTLGRVFR